MTNTAHLFSGGGGGLLADLILGHNPILAVDIDEVCCENLRRRKSEWFPNLEVVKSDLGTFDASKYKGRLDILHAGIPCPRWSNAKRGRGKTYDGLPDTVRITNQCRPKRVFLECVANFSRDHDRARGLFKEIGYYLSRPLITDASRLGAPHSRRRYWAIAYADYESKSVCTYNAEMAFMSPTNSGLWWEAAPRVSGVDDGMADRVHRFKMTGNGQVPLQAAAAYLMLTKDLKKSCIA